MDYFPTTCADKPASISFGVFFYFLVVPKTFNTLWRLESY